jgi:hypothetical protein
MVNLLVCKPCRWVAWLRSRVDATRTEACSLCSTMASAPTLLPSSSLLPFFFSSSLLFFLIFFGLLPFLIRTSRDFHRFPFDKQDLVIEISTTQTQPDKIAIVPSGAWQRLQDSLCPPPTPAPTNTHTHTHTHTRVIMLLSSNMAIMLLLNDSLPCCVLRCSLIAATQHELFMRGPGDDLSTWTVQGVHVLALPPVRGSDLTKTSTAVDPGDPSPQSVVGATPAQIANSIVPNLWFHGAQVHIIVRLQLRKHI